MSDVNKPAALGKAPETEATLDTLPMNLDFLSNDFELRPDLFDNNLPNINTDNVERVPVNTVEQENNMNKLNIKSIMRLITWYKTLPQI